MNLLRCPLCHSPLTENSQGVACINHHQFDRAREGYLNLLPVQQKNSREPGDARQQLQARQQFLRRGYFDVLLEQLVDLIPSDTASLLDLGSGDGYFSLELQSRLPTTEIIGIDIAKEGARLAAKAARQKHLSTQFCVASNFTLPIMDNSLDVVTRIFAPSKDTELKRVLKAGGHLIIVTPGPGHLLGLRKSLYTEVREHPEPVAPEGFRCLDTRWVAQPLKVPPGTDSRALLAMTPFAWKMRAGVLDDLIHAGINDQLEFQIHLFGLGAE